MNGRVRLAENESQFRRIDERRPAEGVEQLSFGEGHVSSVAKKGCRGKHADDSIGSREEGSRCSSFPGCT